MAETPLYRRLGVQPEMSAPPSAVRLGGSDTFCTYWTNGTTSGTTDLVNDEVIP